MTYYYDWFNLGIHECQLISGSCESTVGNDDAAQIPAADTPRKKRLKANLRNERVRTCRLKKRMIAREMVFNKNAGKIKTPDEIINAASNYLEKMPLAFFSSQIKMSQRKKKGERWTENDKLIALSIYYQSPKAYRFLCKLFRLPTTRSIRRWVEGINITPGFHVQTIELLSKRFEKLASHEKECVIVFDEMSLKENLVYSHTNDKLIGLEDYGQCGAEDGFSKRVANSALVVLARGLTSKWKQPLGFFLSCDSTPVDKLKVIILDAVKCVQKAGGNVRVILCDQGSTNRSLYIKLGVTISHPYFEIENEEDKSAPKQRIYCMFDPPHLIKSTRNNLQKYMIKVNNKLIKWSHIKSFYDKDSSLPIRMCPKLTNKHLVLTNFSKMRVNLATQVLSHGVAAGIMTHVSLGSLPKEAVHTAEFIERMDQLFDCFNSGTLVNILKPHRAAISPTSIHMKFLTDCKDWINTWVPVGNRSELYFINGWKLSISVLCSLWADLNKDNLKFLLTNRLNQDCLENMFGVIRQSGLCRDNPTPEQFAPSFRQCLVNNLLTPPKGSNCGVDFDTVITSLSTMSAGKSKTKKDEVTSDNTNKDDNDMSLEGLSDTLASLPEQNVLTYITGYLLKRLKSKHNCTECDFTTLEGESEYKDSTQDFLYWKSLCKSKGVFGGLTVPNKALVSLINICEDGFVANFDAVCHMPHLRVKLVSEIEKKIVTPKDVVLCKIGLSVLVNMYVSLRICAAVKFFNRDLEESKKTKSKNPRKCRKSMKVMHL